MDKTIYRGDKAHDVWVEVYGVYEGEDASFNGPAFADSAEFDVFIGNRSVMHLLTENELTNILDDILEEARESWEDCDQEPPDRDY